MQVIGLSAASLRNLPQQNHLVTNGSGFAGILSEQLLENVHLAEQSLVKKCESLAGREIMELLKLLQFEDTAELFESLETEDFIELDGDLDYLQLSEEDILSSLLFFLAGVHVNDGATQGNLLELLEAGAFVHDHEMLPSKIERKLDHTFERVFANDVIPSGKQETALQYLAELKEAVSQGNMADSFQAVVNILGQLDMKQAAIDINEEAIPAIKSLKLYQLLHKKDEKELHVLLEKISGTLKELKLQEKTMRQTEWLQQTFSPIVKEAKQGAAPFKPVYPVLGMNLQLNESSNERSVKLGNISPHTENSAVFSLQQLPKSEPFLLMLENSGKPVNSEQLITQFERILANSRIVNTGSTKRMFIKLYPEHLGTVKVELLQQESGLTAKIMAANSTAKELLESQLQHLSRAFSQQNIQLEKIEITVGNNEQQERIFNRDSEREQQRQQQEEQQKQKHEEKDDYNLSFAEALISAEV